MLATPDQSPRTKRRSLIGNVFLALICGVGLAGAEVTVVNPIGKVARLFNPRLVKLEDRVEFLSRQLTRKS